MHIVNTPDFCMMILRIHNMYEYIGLSDSKKPKVKMSYMSLIA